MNDSEYRNIFHNEDQHPWYCHLRKLVDFYLKRYAPQPLEKCSLLDAGCGAGGQLAYLLKTTPLKRIFALDKHPLALEYTAKRTLPISLVRGSVEGLPFQDNCFDVVLCLDVLYMKGIQLDRSFVSLYQCLKPGGILILNAAAMPCFHGPHDLLVAAAHRFTQQELRTNLCASGFIVLKTSYWNMLLAPALFLKRRLSMLLRSGEPKSDLRPLPKMLKMFLDLIFKIEGFFFKQTGLCFGTSVFLVAQKPLELM